MNLSEVQRWQRANRAYVDQLFEEIDGIAEEGDLGSVEEFVESVRSQYEAQGMISGAQIRGLENVRDRLERGRT